MPYLRCMEPIEDIKDYRSMSESQLKFLFRSTRGMEQVEHVKWEGPERSEAK